MKQILPLALLVAASMSGCKEKPSDPYETQRKQAMSVCESYSGGASSVEFLEDRRFSQAVKEAAKILTERHKFQCRPLWYCHMTPQGPRFQDKGIHCEYK